MVGGMGVIIARRWYGVGWVNSKRGRSLCALSPQLPGVSPIMRERGSSGLGGLSTYLRWLRSQANQHDVAIGMMALNASKMYAHTMISVSASEDGAAT